MADEYLFISDCHLDAGRPDITSQLAAFLTNRATQARFLYILGDLFDTWIGDDDPAPEHAEFFHCFQELSRTTEIFFLACNRDFLLGEKGAQRIGASLITEPRYLTLEDNRTVLLHGDSMCTDDPEYQDFRIMVRGQQWQSQFLARTLAERRHIATGLRQQSKAAMQHKSMDIMDVNRDTVIKCFTEFGVDTMIHGHTHRPAVHSYNNHKTRYVLGDWNPHPSYLSWQAQRGFELTDLRV